jgi:hypothetical protein
MKRNCCVCGEPIAAARLEYLPDTQHCVKCVDAHGPKVVHDPDELCAKPSLSCQNGFAPKD